MGTTAGYTLADYVHQQISRDRRARRVPAEAWEAFLGHAGDAADLGRLGLSADRRALYCYALPAYRRAGPQEYIAARRLAEILARRGDLDELMLLADSGNEPADEQVARLLAERGAVDALRRRIDTRYSLTGRLVQQREFAALLARTGNVEELRRRADAGNTAAGDQLAAILVERDVDELTERAVAGDLGAAQKLIDLLTAQGRAREAVEIIRRQADLDPLPMPNSWWGLTLLTVEGRVEELRAACERAVVPWARPMLARGLSVHGRLGELRGLADGGDGVAADSLANLLDKRDHLDELRIRADRGDESAARVLLGREVRGLAADGDVAALRTLAPTNRQAAAALVDVLADRGDIPALKELGDEGDDSAAARAAELLASVGDEAGLRDSVDRGHNSAAERLADVLAAAGRAIDGNRLRCFGLRPDGSIAEGPL